MQDNRTGREKHIIYIGGSPYDSEIIFVKDFTESTGSYKFLHKDYLGSILAISDEAGNKVEQRHYDAWGNLTHLQLGSGEVLTGSQLPTAYGLLLIARGYTSHEHLFGVGLIHMNGRLYDPLLRRFLNADENIQDPYNTQNYNKYGYVYNNPLMYNDPSGEFAFLVPVFAWIASKAVAIMTGALIGALIGGGMYAIQAHMSGTWSWGGFAKAFFGGALVGAISGGLGQVFSAGGFWATVGNGALSGAGSGGINALLNGQNFLEGLTKGAIIGGAIGAVSYGIGKLFQGKNSVQLNADGEFSYDGQQFQSKEELLKYIQENNGDVNTIMKETNIKDIRLATSNDLPHSKERFLKLENGLMKEYSSAYGKITYKGTVLAKTIGDKSGVTIYVSPSLKGLNINGTYIGKSILNHEFIHAKHISLGLTNTIFLERSAWSYNYAYAKYHNLPLEIFRQNVNRYGGFNIPSNYKWSKLGLEKFLRLF